MKGAVALIIAVLLGGCGYLPSAKFARSVLGDKVYVTLDILASEPENAIIIKDALNEALISRFRVTLTKESESLSQLRVKVASLSFVPIEYDSNGYIVAQRANIVLAIVRTRNKAAKNYAVSGSYDFSIDPNGVVSDKQRFQAIKSASLRALESLVTNLAVEGVK